MALSDRSPDLRVIVVTGKGGVGKTTISAALGAQAAALGLRTIVCETSGANQVCARFGVPFTPYTVTQLQPNLYTLSIQPEAAIEEYMLRVLRFRKLYEMVFKNRVMGPFLDAVPGMHDLIQLGKVCDLERERLPGGVAGLGPGRRAWDLIIIDAPATGHGISMLTSPRGMMRLTRGGPLHDNAQDIAALIEDPARTRLLLVSLPEDLPVLETTELYGRLGTFREQVSGVVLNAVQTSGLPQVYPLVRVQLAAQANPAGIEALGFADAAVQLYDTQDRARQALSRLGPALVDLPETALQDSSCYAALGAPLARMLGLGAP